MATPLCELIAKSRNMDGVLPEGFMLPDEDNGDGPRFADGAMDGIMMYHMGHTPLTDAEKQHLVKLLTLAGDGKEKEAKEGFKDFCKDHRTLSIIDDMQQYIVNHPDRINADNLFRFAVNMLLESTDKESVKVGLSILELFDSYENDELARVIRIAGLSDEFTLFSVFNMRNWPAAEKEILELGKRVRGWGRIHCVDFMDAEEEETRQWLFYHGVDNDVLPAYSGWTVYQKADVEGILNKPELTYEELHAVLLITDALMDEGPVSGLSNMENPKEYLTRVQLKAKGDYPFTDDDKRILNTMKEWS